MTWNLLDIFWQWIEWECNVRIDPFVPDKPEGYLQIIGPVQDEVGIRCSLRVDSIGRRLTCLMFDEKDTSKQTVSRISFHGFRFTDFVSRILTS